MAAPPATRPAAPDARVKRSEPTKWPVDPPPYLLTVAANGQGDWPSVTMVGRPLESRESLVAWVRAGIADPEFVAAIQATPDLPFEQGLRLLSALAVTPTSKAYAGLADGGVVEWDVGRAFGRTDGGPPPLRQAAVDLWVDLGPSLDLRLRVGRRDAAEVTLREAAAAVYRNPGVVRVWVSPEVSFAEASAVYAGLRAVRRADVLMAVAEPPVRAATGAPRPVQGVVTVFNAGDGQWPAVWCDDARVESKDALAAVLRGRVAAEPTFEVVIVAGRDVRFQALHQVLGAVGEAGVARFHFRAPAGKK
jgi:biopolymer transport protein ExbD